MNVNRIRYRLSRESTFIAWTALSPRDLSSLQLFDLLDDGICVLLRRRLASEIASDGLALSDGLWVHVSSDALLNREIRLVPKAPLARFFPRTRTDSCA